MVFRKIRKSAIYGQILRKYIWFSIHDTKTCRHITSLQNQPYWPCRTYYNVLKHSITYYNILKHSRMLKKVLEYQNYVCRRVLRCNSQNYKNLIDPSRFKNILARSGMFQKGQSFVRGCVCTCICRSVFRLTCQNLFEISTSVGAVWIICQLSTQIIHSII